MLISSRRESACVRSRYIIRIFSHSNTNQQEENRPASGGWDPVKKCVATRSNDTRTEPQQSLGKRRGLRRFDSTAAAAKGGGHRRGHLAWWWWRSCSAIKSSIKCRSDSFTKPKCTSSWASASGKSPGSTGHVNCRFILSSIRKSSVICKSVALITASSRRFTEHIMVTTRRASTSTGSGDSDFTDDSVVTSGDAARVRAGANAVSG